jgi:predicted dehydrogenase
VLGGERFPYHGRFVPGSGIGIGFEDLIAIEDFEFVEAVARGEPHEPGFEDAVRAVAVQDALVRSWSSGRWEEVVLHQVAA